MSIFVHRVLIVNHDEELVLLLKLELGEILPDLAVNIATGLPRALELARSRQPDLVVLGVDGWPTEARSIYESLQAVLGDHTNFVLVGHQPALHQLHDLPALAYLPRPVKLRAFREALGKAPARRVIREDVRPETAASSPKTISS